MLKDPKDIIPFGTLIEVQPALAKTASASRKDNEKKEGSLSQGAAQDTWPGFLTILQATGILFEVSHHKRTWRGEEASLATSPSTEKDSTWLDASGQVIEDTSMAIAFCIRVLHIDMQSIIGEDDHTMRTAVLNTEL